VYNMAPCLITQNASPLCKRT